MRLFSFIINITLTLFVSLSYAQGPYKCDKAGKVVYQDAPCFAAKNEPVKPESTKPASPEKITPPSFHEREAARLRAIQDQVELLRKEEAERQRLENQANAQANAANAANSAREKRTALNFDKYTNIRSGMSTQEVLLKAGAPSNKDFAVQHSRCALEQHYESWLYPADDFEANNTIVEFCNNVVVNVKRFK